MSNYSACLQTASINLGCASNVGGIVKAYFGGNITGVTYNASGEVTGVTGNGNIYTYEVQKQTSSLAETFNSSLENGTVFYQQDLTLVFHKMDQDKRNQLKLLSINRGLIGFVEDNNGTIWMLGEDSIIGGGYLSAGSGASGTAFGDSNQYSVTLTFFSTEPMTTVDGSLSSVVTGLTINP